MKSVNEFDGGIACIIRGAPENFEQSMLECELIEPTNSDFVHEQNEELVSNIIRITTKEEMELDVSSCRHHLYKLHCNLVITRSFIARIWL